MESYGVSHIPTRQTNHNSFFFIFKKCKAITGLKTKCKLTTGLTPKSVNFFQDDTCRECVKLCQSVSPILRKCLIYIGCVCHVCQLFHPGHLFADTRANKSDGKGPAGIPVSGNSTSAK